MSSSEAGAVTGAGDRCRVARTRQPVGAVAIPAATGGGLHPATTSIGDIPLDAVPANSGRCCGDARNERDGGSPGSRCEVGVDGLGATGRVGTGGPCPATDRASDSSVGTRRGRLVR